MQMTDDQVLANIMLSAWTGLRASDILTAGRHQLFGIAVEEKLAERQVAAHQKHDGQARAAVLRGGGHRRAIHGARTLVPTVEADWELIRRFHGERPLVNMCTWTVLAVNRDEWCRQRLVSIAWSPDSLPATPRMRATGPVRTNRQSGVRPAKTPERVRRSPAASPPESDASTPDSALAGIPRACM